MAGSLPVLNERTDSISPSSLRISLRDGQATLTLLTESQVMTAAGIQNTLSAILGNVATGATKGSLQRTLPIAHPMCPWLFASSIDGVRGIGNPVQTAPALALEVPVQLPGFALYDTYEFTTTFTPRPYAVLQDSSIVLQMGQKWFNEQGVQQTSNFSQEWLRFTDYDMQPLNEVVKAQQGNMLFRTQSGNAPNGNPFMDMPRLRLPDRALKLTWFQVPYRYISSSKSYIEKYQGYINQLDWYNWKAGQLLYINYKPIRYTPPVPSLDPWFSGLFSTEKYVDIEFTFLLTNRTATDVPTPSNGNWIAAGWNLEPWFQTRSFYYATSYNSSAPTDITQWTPMWQSFPFQLLFTDPDAT